MQGHIFSRSGILKCRTPLKLLHCLHQLPLLVLHYNAFTASMLKEAHSKKVKLADLQMRLFYC